MSHRVKRLKGNNQISIGDTKWVRKLCGEWAKQLRPKADPVREWMKVRREYGSLDTEKSGLGGIISYRQIHYGKSEEERRCIKRLCSAKNRISFKRVKYYLSYCFTQTPIFLRIVRELLRWYTTYEMSTIIETFQGVVEIRGYEYPSGKGNVLSIGGPSFALQHIWNMIKREIIVKRLTETYLRYQSSSPMVFGETNPVDWSGGVYSKELCWAYCDDFLILRRGIFAVVRGVSNEMQ